MSGKCGSQGLYQRCIAFAEFSVPYIIYTLNSETASAWMLVAGTAPVGTFFGGLWSEDLGLWLRLSGFWGLMVVCSGMRFGTRGEDQSSGEF